jgi:hypothetical protein
MENLNTARTIMAAADAASIERRVQQLQSLHPALTIMASHVASIEPLVQQLAYQLLVQRGITAEELIGEKDGQVVFRWPVAWPKALNAPQAGGPPHPDEPPHRAEPGSR